ncbi:MAG: cytochrome-c oxidase, cbb3-type subunit II, partial [Terrimicrobiaceae bacterium]
LTLRGAWDKLRTDPVLKFFAAGVTFYGMSTFEGPLLAIRSINALSHYTDWTIGHVHSGTLGWNSFMAAGMFYWLAPRLWGTKLYSVRLADIHFWLGMVGILLYVASMWVSGITQGLMLNAVTPDGVLAYPNFLEVALSVRAMLHMRILGGGLFLLGFILMIFNLWKTVRSGRPVVTTVDVVVPEKPSREGLGLLETFFNAPVAYSALLVLFGCLWGFTSGVISTISLVLLVETVLAAMIHLSLSGAKWNTWYDRLLESWLPFTILTLIAVVLGGMIQILPLVFSKQAIGYEKVLQTVYTPLELAGRDIYIREGCYNCHSQMIRPLVGEVLRYGPSGRLGESVYDYPFQWGSKRTGPDLEREGGRYPNAWHFQHMENPRSTSVGSNMPAYPWLYRQKTDLAALPAKIAVLRRLGVPFAERSPEQIRDESLAQAATFTADLAKSGVQIGPDKEIIALIAYLQQLGRLKPAADPAAGTAQATVR